MRNFKRFAAVLLAAVMVICLAPATAFAAEEQEEIRVYYYAYQDNGAEMASFYQSVNKGKFTLATFDETGLMAQDGEFKGWALGTDTEYYYNEGDRVSVSQNDDDSYDRIRIYGVWGPAKGQVKVTFGAGASEYQGTVPETLFIKAGSELTLPSNPFTVAGYTFAGWKVGNSTYEAGTILEVSSDITVTAMWSASTVKITYQPGEGKGTDFTSNEVEKGGQITLAANVFTRGGYVFAGWNINGQVYQPGTAATLNGDATATATWTAAQTSSVPQSSSSSSSVPESSSEPEPPEEESSEPESSEVSREPKPEPESSLSYKVEDSGSAVTNIEMELNEDLGNTQLWVVALNRDLAGDATTRALIDSGVAAYDLSLLQDGSSYRGGASGKVEFSLTGRQSASDSPYDEAVLAVFHVIPADSFTGDSYYKKSGRKAVLWDIKDESGEKAPEVRFDDQDGVNRLVITEYEKLPASFAYMSAKDVIVEVQLVANVSATSVTAGFDSLSPFVLGWIELSAAKAAGGFTIPAWMWIIIGGIVVFGILAALLIFLRGRDTDEDRAASRLARREAIDERQRQYSPQPPRQMPVKHGPETQSDHRQFHDSGSQPAANVKPVSGSRCAKDDKDDDWGQF